MWCCSFPIYICDINFLIWLRHWSCFRRSDKSGYSSLYIQFYKLLWLWFCVDFFLNLGFYYNAVDCSGSQSMGRDPKLGRLIILLGRLFFCKHLQRVKLAESNDK